MQPLDKPKKRINSKRLSYTPSLTNSKLVTEVKSSRKSIDHKGEEVEGSVKEAHTCERPVAGTKFKTARQILKKQAEYYSGYHGLNETV